MVRTTKARMAEITTTLKGRAGDRDQSRCEHTGQLLSSSSLGALQIPLYPSCPEGSPCLSNSNQWETLDLLQWPCLWPLL